jgi:hypothetical protein
MPVYLERFETQAGRAAHGWWCGAPHHQMPVSRLSPAMYSGQAWRMLNSTKGTPMGPVLAVGVLAANPFDFDAYWYAPRPSRARPILGRVRALGLRARAARLSATVPAHKRSTSPARAEA